MKKKSQLASYSLKTIVVMVLPVIIGLLALAFFTKLSQKKTETTESYAAEPNAALSPSEVLAKGYVDRIDSDGRVWGWIYNPGYQKYSVSAIFYVDGKSSDRPLQKQYIAGYVFANNPRADVNKNIGISGNHGFNYMLPAKYKDGKMHTLYVFQSTYYAKNMGPIDPKQRYNFIYRNNKFESSVPDSTAF